MAADIELLPLPDEFADKIEVYVANPFARPTIIGLAQAYARANVEANTEALRAEVEALKGDVARLGAEARQHLRQAMINGAAALDAEARAERLAEALRRIEALEPAEFNEPETLGLAAMGIAHGALLRDQARGK